MSRVLVSMQSGFRLMTDGLIQDAEFLVTDDTAKMDKSDTEINPAGGSVVSAPAHRAPSLERPFLRVALARLDREHLGDLKTVTKTALAFQGDLVAGHVVEGSLRFSDLEALEVQMGVRGRNASMPKSFPET